MVSDVRTKDGVKYIDVLCDEEVMVGASKVKSLEYELEKRRTPIVKKETELMLVP